LLKEDKQSFDKLVYLLRLMYAVEVDLR